MGKAVKAAEAVSIIGGSDGPTSVFVLGKNRKRTLRQKIRKWRYERRKAYYARKIKPGGHTMDEVIVYIKEKYGFVEILVDSEEYQRQYKELRTSFIMQYEPQLLGKYATRPELKAYDAEAVKEFWEELELCQKAAEKVPKESFPIDFHMLRKEKNGKIMHLELEGRFGCISGGSGGLTKGGSRKFNRMYRDIHLYYGVEHEDIVKESERYRQLLAELAMR